MRFTDRSYGSERRRNASRLPLLTAAMSIVAPPAGAHPREKRRVVLWPLQTLDARAGSETRGHQAVGRLGERREHLAESGREVAAEADTVDADHADRVLEMVDDPIEGAGIVPDGKRMEHQSEDARRQSASERSWSSVRLRGWSYDRPASRVRADHRSAVQPREDLGERGRRGVREVEDDAELDEPVDESAPEAREPTVFRGSVGVRVATVPGQPGHPDAELPERLGRPELVAELLDAFEREHQPDSLAPLDGVEVGGRADLQRPVAVLADGAEEAGRLAERLAERSLRLAVELDEDRADLQPDAAGFEQGQPGAGEGVGLADAELAVARARRAGRRGRRRSRAAVYEVAGCGRSGKPGTGLSRADSELAAGCLLHRRRAGTVLNQILTSTFGV